MEQTRSIVHTIPCQGSQLHHFRYAFYHFMFVLKLKHLILIRRNCRRCRVSFQSWNLYKSHHQRHFIFLRTYICTAISSSPGASVDVTTVLVVTGAVPHFSQNTIASYMALPTLPDSYLKFEIEISFRPDDRNGKSYNSFFYLLLNNFIKFRYDDLQRSNERRKWWFHIIRLVKWYYFLYFHFHLY